MIRTVFVIAAVFWAGTAYGQSTTTTCNGGWGTINCQSRTSKGIDASIPLRAAQRDWSMVDIIARNRAEQEDRRAREEAQNFARGQAEQQAAQAAISAATMRGAD